MISTTADMSTSAKALSESLPRHVVADLEAVEKVYQMGEAQVRALAGVTVGFHRGGFYAIMGASGSGKSTMLNLLGCLDRPTAGRYLLEGQNVAELNDDALSEFRLRHLGFIFQSFNLIPQLTVGENIELPLYYLDWETDENNARAEAMATRVGLADRLDHRPAELSGGEDVARELVVQGAGIDTRYAHRRRAAEREEHQAREKG